MATLNLHHDASLALTLFLPQPAFPEALNLPLQLILLGHQLRTCDVERLDLLFWCSFEDLLSSLVHLNVTLQCSAVNGPSNGDGCDCARENPATHGLRCRHGDFDISALDEGRK